MKTTRTLSAATTQRNRDISSHNRSIQNLGLFAILLATSARYSPNTSA